MALSPARRIAGGALGALARQLDRVATTVAPPRRVLVLGGARSGKSHLAERMVSRHGEVVYIATGHVPDGDDPEWAERVRAHRERRPASWHTVETTDLPAALRGAHAPVLVDCLATWLARVLDDAGAWDGDQRWRRRVDERVAELVEAWQGLTVPAVAVSNEVGSGVVPATPAGRLFRDALGSVNSTVAGASDSVRFVVAGRAIELPRQRP
ncbi:bifunctional adenosylcobinamide kinase/adenosylcobinamide-phosphate guanylyltransferase [Haloechinothrix aidingensis]|nr:bifunctional adenosylcobinamide kinase/adenosylcobinamide-phosphate guanylyltransferase [Haloechinothrix aidingensis]